MNQSDSTVFSLYVINLVDIHVFLPKGPSVTNVDDNMHALNVSDNSFNFETSHGNNLNYGNQFSDMTIFSDTLSNDIMRPSHKGLNKCLITYTHYLIHTNQVPP